MRRLIVLPVLAGLLGPLVACSPKAPSRDEAVAVLRENCDVQSGQLTRLPAPDGVFRLSDIAHDAFRALDQGLGELDAEGLNAMDDDRPVQRYLRGAIGANNAMAEVSRAAGFEDVGAMRAAIEDAAEAVDDLDRAAEVLDLPRHCGGQAWGSGLFDAAGDVADAEEAAMEPTDDLVEDITTYCKRWARSLRRAPDPGRPSADRAWAFAVGHAVDLLGERLDRLDPPKPQAAAFDVLTEAVADAAEILAPSETAAIDGETAKLDALVEDAQREVRRVDALLVSLGPSC